MRFYSLRFFSLLMLWSTFAFSGATMAASKAAENEDKLVERITERVKKELQESPWMQEQIQKGIQAQMTKDREAQAKAQAERFRQLQEKAKAVRPPDPSRDHIYGKPDAVISLFEYSDFECPYCKRFHGTPKRLVDSMGGKLNTVYRHFPLGFHNPNAELEARASECANILAGQEAFWKMTDGIYAKTASNGKGIAPDQLNQLAVDSGLELDAFKECLASGKTAARVKEDIDEAVRIGVAGTPTVILRNNQTGEIRLRSGGSPEEQFKSDIEQMGGVKAKP